MPQVDTMVERSSSLAFISEYLAVKPLGAHTLFFVLFLLLAPFHSHLKYFERRVPERLGVESP